MSLLIGALLLSVPMGPQDGSRVLHVGGDGAFRSVQAALVAAGPGDTVSVAAGRYAEPTLVIEKAITLQGKPGAILDGEGERGLIEIRSDSVTVTGMTLRNTGISFTSDRSAILAEDARYCRIEDNRVEDAFFGIYLANSGNCVVARNVLVASGDRESRSGNGIHLWYSKEIEIVGNRIEGHRDGIYFEFVEDSQVRENESRRNVRYGLHFMFSDRSTYTANVFAENGAGVAVMYTQGIVMEANDFQGNLGNAAFGLLLKDITDSEIRGNRFLGNSIALHAEGANRVQVADNLYVRNGWAIRIMANSEGSTVTGNNFLGNSFDVATNSRRSYSDFRGNFWDRYRGYDRNGDGVGDVPFHPVRLFSLVVAQNEPALVLQRSPLVALLDVAEQVLPVLTPASLVDPSPMLEPFPSGWGREP
ncbi:MAG: nitrous oxide reductase family maturation protein NosD [Gemmatimonadetes bacterium]|nr:nitrous oxide reductase family maturation protein NosD [Gemmatimonadota bacterium]